MGFGPDSQQPFSTNLVVIRSNGVVFLKNYKQVQASVLLEDFSQPGNQKLFLLMLKSQVGQLKLKLAVVYS